MFLNNSLARYRNILIQLSICVERAAEGSRCVFAVPTPDEQKNISDVFLRYFGEMVDKHNGFVYGFRGGGSIELTTDSLKGEN